MAAEKLGLDTVPVVRADDLSEAQIKALRLADNKTNESGWDFTTLEAELDELAEEFEMSDFGFDEDQDGGEDDEAPASFKEYGEDMETKNKCPRCGYEWN
jgi:ParB-like chromosome segregation protein Spo0J